MLFVANTRNWAAAGIVYAPIVFVFGMTQMSLLVGSLHWLIQTAHLLVGIGALALSDNLCNRYLRAQTPLRAAAKTPRT
jgi:type IV secretory pathway VirB3-like protein